MIVLSSIIKPGHDKPEPTHIRCDNCRSETPIAERMNWFAIWIAAANMVEPPPAQIPFQEKHLCLRCLRKKMGWAFPDAKFREAPE